MNSFRTMLLLAAMTALFMALGYTLGGPGGAIIAFGVAALMNLFTYWNADRIVLSMHNAHEVGERDCPVLNGIVLVVEWGATSAGAVAASAEHLDRAQARALGFVLSKASR